MKVAHNWQGTDDRVFRDSEHIPGLQITESGIARGSWDALELLRQRGEGDFVVPKELNACLPISSGEVFYGKLYDYQQYGVRWILDRWTHVGGCILADDMGLGKTTVTIHAAEQAGGLKLVVCPASVRLTWEKEIKKWANQKAFIVRDGTSAAASAMHSGMWIVSSYELMQSLPQSLFPNTVIIDEAHNFSGRFAKRSRKLQHFCALASNRIALTGTPIWSRPRDYWQLLRCLLGNTFGSSWDFDMAYCNGFINEHGGLDNKGTSREDELKFRMNWYQLRRLKSDVKNELPALTRQLLWVEPQPRATEAMKQALLHRTKGSTYAALSAALDGKMEAAMDVAQAAGKFLLFTWQKKHAKWMSEQLEKRGTPNYLITGETSHGQRRTIIEASRAGGVGIVATIDSIGTGVDGLQHVASTGIFHSTDFVPLKLLQAEKRLDRLGQTAPCHWVYVMMRESMDQWVGEKVIEKLSTWTKLMGKDEAADLEGTLSERGAGTVEEAEARALASLYGEA